MTHMGLKLLSAAQMMLSPLENWDLAKARIWLIVHEFFQASTFHQELNQSDADALMKTNI